MIDLNTDLQKAANLYGDELLKNLAKIIVESDSVASRKMLDSLQFDVSSAVNQIIINVYGEDYFKYQDKGVAAGKTPPPLSKIIAWTQYRGIDKKAAFPIQQKIGKFGIPAKNIIDQLIRENELKLGAKFEQRFAEIVSKKLDEIIK